MRRSRTGGLGYLVSNGGYAIRGYSGTNDKGGRCGYSADASRCARRSCSTRRAGSSCGCCMRTMRALPTMRTTVIARMQIF